MKLKSLSASDVKISALKKKLLYKKSNCVLRSGSASPQMKFSFIDEERTSHSIKTLCRVLKVSRQGYYAWKSREISEHDKQDLHLGKLICKLHALHRGVYGNR